MKKSLNSAKSLINEKINRLIALSLNNGIQPEDLATNIFESPYESIFIHKAQNKIYVELIFSEDTDLLGEISKVKYIYTYSLDKILFKIEYLTDNKRKTEWDRTEIEKELIDSIISLLKDNKLDNDVDKFIGSLPEAMKLSILKNVA